MPANINHLLLEHLRSIRADTAGIWSEVREMKMRVTSLEAGQATVIQHLGHLSGTAAEQHLRYDRLLERIERIERRLELVPGAAPQG
jgi:uncharacterized coiled-coil protein SlyX